ncbi:DsbA family oxidoreductase [Dyella choica]|uniref:DsbA family oxidoreductase n=1 Tax=Dyella choica TaxID=1927959 RepID=A0A432M9W8_9GAMM|nr:DsbA family oxidoreductase [Dyella choica]RUL78989.1 DsbA family oxidoreductase [Dyella choica]
MHSIKVDVTYDFICPWCWIAHRHLRMAIEKAGADGAINTAYVPYELNPHMPKSGTSRKQYRTAKFGSWDRSLLMDAQVTQAGCLVGLDFHYDRVALTPNTRLAHQLMAYAKEHGESRQVDALYEAIFAAYFSEGRDIGSLEVLVELAIETGFNGEQARHYLQANAGEHEVVRAQRQAMADGVRSVPSIRIGDIGISGAQPADVLREAIEAAGAVEP